MCSSDIFLGVLAILFPPIAVWIKCGLCSADSIINILLCMLGYVPGLLHAWYIIAKYPDDTNDYESIPQDAESGRVHYIVVQGPAGQPRRQQRPTAAPKNTGYGATDGAASATTVEPQQRQGENGTWSQSGAAGEGSAGAPVPPTYDEAIRGDHKVQSS